MDIVISLLAIIGLAFFIKETDGPWDLMRKIRLSLFSNKWFGVFFFKLLDCYFCLGFHCGWIVYLFNYKKLEWNFIFLWGLAGAAVSLIFSILMNKLSDSSK
jgi:hypothetical protein